MSIANDILANLERDQAKDLCFRIKSHLGMPGNFHPSILYGFGQAVGAGQNINIELSPDKDRESAVVLLEKIHVIEARFPDIAAQYADCLSAAKRELKRLAPSKC